MFFIISEHPSFGWKSATASTVLLMLTELRMSPSVLSAKLWLSTSYWGQDLFSLLLATSFSAGWGKGYCKLFVVLLIFPQLPWLAAVLLNIAQPVALNFSDFESAPNLGGELLKSKLEFSHHWQFLAYWLIPVQVCASSFTFMTERGWQLQKKSEHFCFIPSSLPVICSKSCFLAAWNADMPWKKIHLPHKYLLISICLYSILHASVKLKLANWIQRPFRDDLAEICPIPVLRWFLVASLFKKIDELISPFDSWCTLFKLWLLDHPFHPPCCFWSFLAATVSQWFHSH